MAERMHACSMHACTRAGVGNEGQNGLPPLGSMGWKWGLACAPAVPHLSLARPALKWRHGVTLPVSAAHAPPHVLHILALVQYELGMYIKTFQCGYKGLQVRARGGLAYTA